MRTALILIFLTALVLSSTGCADVVDPNAPTIGTANITVLASVPRRLVIMPNLKVTIDIAGTATKQTCATNWHKYDCKANAVRPVRKGDLITVKVERALCVAYDCEILEKTFKVDGPLQVREVPTETSELTITADVNVTPS